MKKITLLLLTMLSFCSITYAQLVFDNTCTTVFEDISSTGTDLLLGDDGEATITLPFLFTLDGISSSDLVVGNNGGVLFNETSGSVGTISNPTAQGFYPFIDDIDSDYGGVFWEVLGTAPNRKAVILWNDRPHYSNSSSGATFELILSETTNNITFLYQDTDFGNTSFNDAISAGIRVNGVNGSYVYSTDTALNGVTCINWVVPACPNPSALAAANITDTSADLSWNDLAGASLWNLEIGVNGFSPTGTATQVGVSNPYTANNLTETTDYEYYVQADCVGSTSQWVGPFTFSTIASCLIPTSVLASNITDVSAELSWVAGQGETEWEYALLLATDTEPASGQITQTLGYSATGLLENTNYIFYVRANCSSTDSSFWTQESFTTLYTTPDNDECLNATAITCGETLTNQRTLGATGGTSTSCLGSIGDDVWYQFTGNDSFVTLSLLASTQEGQIGVYESTDGLCSGFSIGTCIASGGNGSTSVDVDFDAHNGVEYFIRIGNWINGDPGVEFEISASCVPFPSCADPIGISTSEITSTTFDVIWDEGIGSGTTINYNYEIQPVGVSQGTAGVISSGVVSTTTLSITGLEAVTSYDIFIQANCDLNGNSSWVGPLTVTTLPAPPVNDDCDNAIALTVNDDYSCVSITNGTVIGATDSGVTGSTCGGTDDDDVWYSFVATSAAHRVSLINITGSTSDMYLSVYEASAGCGTLGAALLCSDPQTADLVALTIGSTYYIQVYTYTSTINQTSIFDICVGTPPAPSTNVSCALAETISCGETLEGNSVSSTGTSEDIGCSMGSNGLWYTFVGTGNDVTLSSTANFDHRMAIASGSCGFLANIVCDDESTGAESHTFTSVLNETYSVYVAHYSSGNSSVGVITLNLTCAAPSNDECANPDILTVGTMVSGDTTYATDSGVAASSCGTAGADQDIWYSFTATAAMATEGASFTTTADHLVVYADCAATTEIACLATGENTPALTSGTTYIVRAYNSGIAKVAGPIEITLQEGSLSTSDFDSTSIFSYYPNPVKNTLTLNAQQAITNVSVFNMLGQQVIRNAPNAVTKTLDMSNLQSGAYFVQVTVGTSVETVRIIKN